MSTRTTTVRIPSYRIQQIDELCKKTGNCRNSWINAAIDFVFETTSNYDFGIDEEDEPEIKKNPTVVIQDSHPSESVPTGKITKVSYDDGKTWHDLN